MQSLSVKSKIIIIMGWGWG